VVLGIIKSFTTQKARLDKTGFFLYQPNLTDTGKTIATAKVRQGRDSLMVHWLEG